MIQGVINPLKDKIGEHFNHLPAQLENIDASKIGNPELMSPAEIRVWIRERKAAAANET